MIRDGRYANPHEYPGPKPLNEWSDEEVYLRANTYESNRGKKIEELELTDAILIPLRAEAMRRGMIRDERGRWEQPKAESDLRQ